ncbi:MULTISPECIES: Ger(x)C family spore germination protein [unclassified Paenibacillus]|uniref:Ger(x)C family spore germination protein n=1 Tax=unclassified Paenibacillus TaxID=185978 RepID=UPI000838682C|nr:MULTISPECIES: Ger(x)C family spore germination protein [unclassified Paenibacillus]NWL89489.1 Ger(x)C family spore germination protein [Paenibacillus sp. 79R4]
MRFKFRSLFLPGLLLLFMLPLSGCWDVKDIDNRLLVTVLGIEEIPNNQVKIWARFPLPSVKETSGGGTDKDYITVKQVGDTVVDALDGIRLKLTKFIDLSQTRTIFLDQRLAKKGFLPYLEFAMRDRTLPLDALVTVVSGDMEEVLDQPYPTGELSGIYSKLFFESYAGGTAQKNKMTLWEIFSRYFNPLEENLIPVLSSDPVTLFKLQGNAYFHGDTMMGMLTPEETLITSIVTNKMFPFEIETAQKMDVRIMSSKSFVRVKMINNKPFIRIRAKTTMTLMDSARGIHLDPSELEASINKLIEERATKVFKRTQQDQADIFRLGNYFRSILPTSQYTHWPELYQQATIDFKIESKLKNTGLQIMKNPTDKTSNDHAKN